MFLGIFSDTSNCSYDIDIAELSFRSLRQVSMGSAVINSQIFSGSTVTPQEDRRPVCDRQ